LLRGWLRVMKQSMGTICPVFNTNRMVQEYIENCYWASDQRYQTLLADNLNKAQQLAQWRKRLGGSWPQIKIEAVDAKNADPLHVGGELQVQARVNLGACTPDDVEVQLFHGLVDSFGEIPNPRTVPMNQNGVHEGNAWTFAGTIPCRASGQHGFAVRVLPKHRDLANSFQTGLVCWG
jgi:starch phosphorylase